MTMTAIKQVSVTRLSRRIVGSLRLSAEDKAQTARNLKIILPAGIALLGVRVMFAFVQQNFQIGDYDLAVIVLMLVLGGLWVLARRGYIMPTATLLLLLAYLGLVYIAAQANKLFDGAFAGLFVVILMAGLLLGWKAAMVMVGLCVAAAWWLYSLTGAATIELPSNAAFEYARDISIVYALAALLIFLLIRDLQQALFRSRANEQIMREQNIELTAMRATLEQRVAERTAQLRTASEVSRVAVSILEPAELLREIVNLITDRFGFYYAAVFELDQSGSYLILRDATGEAGRILKERGHRLRVGLDSMVGYAVIKHEPRVALNAGEDVVRFANPLLPDTQSEIALPLMIGDQVLGALDVQAAQLNAFDETVIATLQNVAAQIAIALQNAESYKRLQQALEHTTRQYELSRTIVSADTPVAAYEALGQVFAMLTDIDRIGLLRVADRDEVGQPTEYALATEWDVLGGARFDTGLQYSVADAPLASLVTPDEVIVIRDSNDNRLPLSTREQLVQVGAQAVMLVPLTIRGRYEGFITAIAEQPHDFQDSEVRLLKSATEQLGVVLSNLQLTADMQSTLERVALLNRRLSGEAWSNYLESRDQWVVESGEAQSALIPAGLQVPIAVRGQMIGMFNVADVTPHRQWQEEELTLLQTIADEVSLAIENARLIEQTQRAAQREKDIASAADKIHRSVDLDAILRTAVEEVMRIAGTTEVAIQLGQIEPAGNGHHATLS